MRRKGIIPVLIVALVAVLAGPAFAEDKKIDATLKLDQGSVAVGIGWSWGGYESLAVPNDPQPNRTVTPWHAEGPLVRLHIGLEDPDDLIADLEAGLRRFAPAT